MMSQGEQEAAMELLRNETTTQERLNVISEVHSYFLARQVDFHDYHFFPQFIVIIQHRFTEHITGKCEVRAIQKPGKTRSSVSRTYVPEGDR